MVALSVSLSTRLPVDFRLFLAYIYIYRLRVFPAEFPIHSADVAAVFATLCHRGWLNNAKTKQGALPRMFLCIIIYTYIHVLTCVYIYIYTYDIPPKKQSIKTPAMSTTLFQFEAPADVFFLGGFGGVWGGAIKVLPPFRFAPPRLPGAAGLGRLSWRIATEIHGQRAKVGATSYESTGCSKQGLQKNTNKQIGNPLVGLHLGKLMGY